MNHDETYKRLTKLDDETLRYIIADCRRAIEAMPSNPKAGDYADESLYCQMILGKRARRARNAKRRGNKAA